jgi:hypothetical protein
MPRAMDTGGRGRAAAAAAFFDLDKTRISRSGTLAFVRSLSSGSDKPRAGRARSVRLAGLQGPAEPINQDGGDHGGAQRARQGLAGRAGYRHSAATFAVVPSVMRTGPQDM